MTLEREKTQLLTQNCQLKRLVDQNDNGGVVEVISNTTTSTSSTISQGPHALKKRKIDTIYTMQTISDSSDEGLGSMSPEPTTVTLVSTTSNPTTVLTTVPSNTAMITTKANQSTTNGSLNSKEFFEMKTLLEMERRKNSALEDRVRQLTECHPPTIYTNGERVTYEPHEVIEHTDNLRHTDDMDHQVHTVLVDKVHHNMQNVRVLALDTTVGQQVVMCPIEHDEIEMVEAVSRMHHNPPHIDDDDSRTLSPCDMKEIISNGSQPQSPVYDHHMPMHTIKSNSIRLQPILEAAIKAEPKVEVERIHSPNSVSILKENDSVNTNGGGGGGGNGGAAPQPSQSRMFITQNTSRQNLETIVEAIRHLEGDQLFGEMSEPTQEAPLALTNKPIQHHHHQPQIQVEMNPYLHFRTTSSSSSPNSNGATIVSQLNPHHSINNRPGVIVVKQHS